MFRYAILSGVSSDVQADDDKGSLDDQIRTARRAGEQQGGRETAGPFILDGYSRTGYVNLSDARQDIPPLQAALEAAERDLYDVLILDNLDRLGDLAPMIATLFKKYKKQIHSARQPSRIFDPIDYDPFSDESADIMIHVEGIIQRYRQNKLRRGLILGVKKRVEDGKYGYRYPYGYLPGPDGDLRLDPPVAHLLTELKDRFLQGASLRSLQAIANGSGVPSAKGGTWHFSSITKILKNPFYAGRVFSNRWKAARAKRVLPNGKRSMTMVLNPNAQLHEGNQPALWTFDEHVRIVAEMEERYRLNPRHNPKNFSGLLRCAVCKKPLKFRSAKYRCRSAPDHIGLSESDANQLIGKAFADALLNYKEADATSRSAGLADETVVELQKRIQKIQHHAEIEDGMYTAREAVEKINALRMQIKAIETRTEDRQHQDAARRRRSVKREEMLPKLRLLPHIFAEEEPAVNNRMMRDFLTAIEVTPEHTFEFHIR